MKKLTVFLCVIVIVFGVIGTANAYIQFNDGGVHNIDYVVSDDVWVDFNTPGAQTTVNIQSGGGLASADYSLEGYEDGIISISGGMIYHLVYNDRSQGYLSDGYVQGTTLKDYSQLTVTGTEFHSLQVFDSSQLIMNGGNIINALEGRDLSSLTVSGGIFDYLRLDNSSVLTIYGMDFAMDGQYLEYGEIFSILGSDPGYEPNRILTGTLASGQALNTDFFIGNSAKIVLAPNPVPLPGAVWLLGSGLIGFIGIRKKLKKFE